MVTKGEQQYQRPGPQLGHIVWLALGSAKLRVLEEGSAGRKEKLNTKWSYFFIFYFFYEAAPCTSISATTTSTQANRRYIHNGILSKFPSRAIVLPYRRAGPACQGPAGDRPSWAFKFTWSWRRFPVNRASSWDSEASLLDLCLPPRWNKVGLNQCYISACRCISTASTVSRLLVVAL